MAYTSKLPATYAFEVYGLPALCDYSFNVDSILNFN